MNFTRVLGLGATGRIGTILRRCWPDGQIQGHNKADISGQALWQARGSAGPVGAGWVVLDPLGDPEALARAATGIDVILCLAGVVPGRGELSDNVALAEAAIRAGAASGARVLLTSSAAVYGAQTGPLAETAPLVPVSAYGRAKVEMEARGTALGAELGVPVCALRIGNIAGIDAILGGWQPGFRLDQFADGRTPQRSYIGMRTLARVLGDLVCAADLPGVLNVAQPGMVEMGALLDAAELDWTGQPAPNTAIAGVALSTKALARFTPLPGIPSAEALVAEWRSLEELAP